MQITLNQSEIEKAIVTYVGNQGISITGKRVDVVLIAGRGANGMSASLDIFDEEQPVVGNTVIDVSSDKVTAEEESPVADPVDDAQQPLFGS